MREILFKGKIENSDEWIEGSLINSKNGEVHILRNTSNKISKYGKSGYWEINSPCYKVYPSTVCQFTGLVDKNGVKVFDNDILHLQTELINIESQKPVSNSEHDNWYKVFWSDEYSCYCLECMKTNRSKFFGVGNIQTFKINSVVSKSEVTGNIHN